MIDSELQSKLDGYAQDAQARATSKSTWKKHLKSWPVYTAAGGASLAVVASAGAEIIYSGLQNLTVNAPAIGMNSVHINIGTGAGIDAEALRPSVFVGTGSVRLRGGGSNAVMLSGALRNVASGVAISGGGSFAGGAAAFGISFGGGFGNFSPSNTGFAGVRLNDPLGTHFGWIRLHVNSGTSMTVIDWAYNDVAGAPINAGDQSTTAVPEPSTMTMVLLGAGSAGVLAWRRRRNEAAATPAA